MFCCFLDFETVKSQTVWEMVAVFFAFSFRVVFFVFQCSLTSWCGDPLDGAAAGWVAAGVVDVVARPLRLEEALRLVDGDGTRAELAAADGTRRQRTLARRPRLRRTRSGVALRFSNQNRL